MKKYRIMLMVFLMMSLSAFSQNTLKQEDKLPNIFPPQTDVIFEDTAICFYKVDAKILLVDLIRGGISDSLILNLENQVSISDSIIEKQIDVINNLEEENQKLVTINTNLDSVLANKQDIINNQLEIDKVREEEKKALQKEIKKQKLLKWLGFIGIMVEAVIFTSVAIGAQ